MSSRAGPPADLRGRKIATGDGELSPKLCLHGAEQRKKSADAGAGMIPNELMGDVWPAVQPGRATSDYARATIASVAPCEVRS